jgi:predicted phage terminase large subunit-like protein
LCIPAIAETEQTLTIGPDQTSIRRRGDVLDPNREPRPVLEQIRREIGPTAFEAQYQQEPVPEVGGLVQWSWFQTYETPPRREHNDQVIISWDTAMKNREVNDYSVGIVALWRFSEQRAYILDIIREHLDFPSLRQTIIVESAKHRATNLIEDAASGTVLLQDLPQNVRRIQMRPFGDKFTRFQSASVKIQAGGVYLPARARWLEAFKREVLTFPDGRNDDQVDALSQLVNWACDRTRFTPLFASYLQ